MGGGGSSRLVDQAWAELRRGTERTEVVPSGPRRVCIRLTGTGDRLNEWTGFTGRRAGAFEDPVRC